MNRFVIAISKWSCSFRNKAKEKVTWCFKAETAPARSFTSLHQLQHVMKLMQHSETQIVHSIAQLQLSTPATQLLVQMNDIQRWIRELVAGRWSLLSPFVPSLSLCHEVAPLNPVNGPGGVLYAPLRALAEPGICRTFYAFWVQKSLLVVTIC